MKTVTGNGQRLAMVVDTGSPVSLVSAETARQRGLQQLLDPCELRLTSFTGQVIPLRGEALVSVTASGRPATRLRLVVTGFGLHRPLMGREWLQALGPMTSSARVYRRERPVPFALQEAMDRELDLWEEREGDGRQRAESTAAQLAGARTELEAAQAERAEAELPLVVLDGSLAASWR